MYDKNRIQQKFGASDRPETAAGVLLPAAVRISELCSLTLRERAFSGGIQTLMKNKNKKPAPAGKPQVRSQDIISRPRAFSPELLLSGALFLFLVAANNWSFRYDLSLPLALGALLILIIALFHHENRKHLFGDVSPVVLLLLAQCFLYFAGMFYGTYPKFALNAFFLNAGGLAVFIVLYAAFRRDGAEIGKITLFFSACIAVASLLSMELATSRYLLGPLQGIAGLVGAQVPADFAIFESNTRMTSVIGNPNVFAQITVLGMFAALWNAGGPGSRSRRSVFSMGLALVCGTAFVLCFSLGTILAYGAALVLALIFSRREDRIALFVSNFYCMAVSLAGAAVFFALRGKGVLPLLAALVLSLLFAYGYAYLRKPERLPALKAGRTGILILCAACAALLLAAALLKGAYSLDAGGTFRRAAALSSGEYSLELTLDGAQEDSPVTVEISSMSYAEAALKEKTVLASGKLRSGEKLVFQVPEGSAAVFFQMTADGALTVTEAAVTGGNTVRRLPLRYLLVPEFIVNRLQGIWVNDNAIQRFIFFRDGLRLAKLSPVLGRGGGAFEGELFGVADYYYETRHVHNEFIQRLIDGGIVGLVLFAGFAALEIRALFKLRRSERTKRLFPFLAAGLFMIFLHCLLEVDFMMPSYRIVSAVPLALAAASYEERFVPGKKAKIAAGTAFSLLFLLTAALALGRTVALSLYAGQQSLAALETANAVDPFDGDDYKLTYLLSTMDSANPSVLYRSSRYLASLEKDNTCAETAFYLARYYLTKPAPDLEDGVRNAEWYVRSKRVDPSAWDNVFLLYNNALEGGSADRRQLAASMEELCAYLTELNGTLPQKVNPSLAVYSCLRARQIEAGGTDGAVLDSRTTCDLDGDGASELLVSSGAGAVKWKLNLLVPAVKSYCVRLYQDESAACRITLDGSGLDCGYNSAEGCFEAYYFRPANSVSSLAVETDRNPDSAYFTVEAADR